MLAATRVRVDYWGRAAINAAVRRLAAGTGLDDAADFTVHGMRGIGL